MNIKTLLILSLFFIFSHNTTSEEIECIDVELNSELIGSNLNLELIISNPCDYPVYFIHNMWFLEFTYFQGVFSPYPEKMRLNRIYFYDDSLKGYKNEGVEKESSKYNEKDIYKIKRNETLRINFTLLLTKSLEKRVRNNDFKYLMKLVFTKEKWDSFLTTTSINIPQLGDQNRVMNSYGYQNSDKVDKYLPYRKYLFINVEGKLNVKRSE